MPHSQEPSAARGTVNANSRVRISITEWRGWFMALKVELVTVMFVVPSSTGIDSFHAFQRIGAPAAAIARRVPPERVSDTLHQMRVSVVAQLAKRNVS